MEHQALIHWSARQIERGLPTVTESTDPAWLEGATPRVDDGWSLVCRFDSTPAQQGSPSAARVHFLVDAAPHEYLRAGAQLRLYELYERATSELARVEILG